jgi:alpha-tubulin suppressor-like RCC1 family protein
MMKKLGFPRAVAAVGLATGLVAAGLFGSTASGEQASSRFRRLPAGYLDAGADHSCAILDTGQVRCWGDGFSGRLGYGNTEDIGDGEAPGSVGPVDVGSGRTAMAIAGGDAHTCAILDTGEVRCWGAGDYGRLGYGNEADVGDTEPPGSRGPVDLGEGQSAVAISTGAEHTCAILGTGGVRCWGEADYGRLGYGNTEDIGDDEDPDSVGPVDLGPGRTAAAVSAGHDVTCAILDTAQVRCWGYGGNGQLGYGNTEAIGDDPGETPGSVGPVDLGSGRTAAVISTGDYHICAILDTGQVRCWGSNTNGQLGYGNTDGIGDDPGETPGSVGPVDLGPGRTAVAISAGASHTCAILDTGQVRCWGYGGDGQLGYGNTEAIGDDPGETPGSVGPVDLGAGRTAVAISAGEDHTCAVLDTGQVRCWGRGLYGQLGYGNTDTIGNDPGETPGGFGPVDLAGLIATTKAPHLSLKAKPKRDPQAPFRFKVRGKLSGPFILDDAVCSGDVVIKTKPKIAKRKTTELEFVGGKCTYHAKLKGRREGTARLIATFEGNGSLDPAKAKRKVRAG